MAALVVAVIVIVGGILAVPRIRKSPWWKATLTPLASIIGSGFLVVTPLLAPTVGRYAPLAMAGIVVVAFGIGSSIRLVIAHGEPQLDGGSSLVRGDLPIPVRLDRVSRLLLGFAYVISVAFYLRLMSSFLLGSITDRAFVFQTFTTVVLVAIAAVGWWRGLHGLELVEELAVSVKLAIIGGLLGGLLVLNVGDIGLVVDAYRGPGVSNDAFTTARILAGMLLVVQGFETSRYLGAHYDRPTRVSSMRAAQLISAAVYVAFVGLSVRVFDALPARVDETAILDAVVEITPILVPLLVVAAVASQLSAAVADTAGGGEMLTGAMKSASASRLGFLFVTAGAIGVVWSVDVFSIVSLASRAFAAYYLVQVVQALLLLRSNKAIAQRGLKLGLNSGLLFGLLFVVIFAIPSG